ncbi:hypothetical protein Cob_v012250 [Colletotrichum orbiculare MAFF 240422]|uniref:Uncharacterized protein n=1 Tax=Colletotrichum orbiculare (strain 104-T / ATCC 96160 / CBS 514.97 / LARS 414 / MAFF 240422) TaxID=1213857 RepID=N4W0H7_COLOR|nr:hypothetical protein Cob_v012250 [Colletotrichum orbiculare MAFF 240422]
MKLWRLDEDRVLRESSNHQLEKEYHERILLCDAFEKWHVNLPRDMNLFITRSLPGPRRFWQLPTTAKYHKYLRPADYTISSSSAPSASTTSPGAQQISFILETRLCSRPRLIHPPIRGAIIMDHVLPLSRNWVDRIFDDYLTPDARAQAHRRPENYEIHPRVFLGVEMTPDVRDRLADNPNLTGRAVYLDQCIQTLGLAAVKHLARQIGITYAIINFELLHSARSLEFRLYHDPDTHRPRLWVSSHDLYPITDAPLEMDNGTLRTTQVAEPMFRNPATPMPAVVDDDIFNEYMDAYVLASVAIIDKKKSDYPALNTAYHVLWEAIMEDAEKRVTEAADEYNEMGDRNT